MAHQQALQAASALAQRSKHTFTGLTGAGRKAGGCSCSWSLGDGLGAAIRKRDWPKTLVAPES